MRLSTRQRPRRGSILPIVAMLLPILCSFTALALDLGILAVSRTNCQSAADSAALVATRTLDNKNMGNNSNQAAATAAAIQDVTDNKLATRPGFPNSTTVEYGLYKYYDSTNPPPPPPPGAPAYSNPGFNVVAWYPSGSALPPGEKSWTASRVTVTANQVSLFSSAMGVTNLNSYAYAVAVYRPRDIAMTLDMTGSMKFGCVVKANGAYMSCDPLYPQAGHFARYTAYTANNPNAGSGAASAASPSGRHNPFFTTNNFDNAGESWAPTNFTVKNAGGPPAVQDFYYDMGNTANPATPLTTPSLPLPKAFHHWEPSMTSVNSPDTYIASSYDYSNWAASTTALTPNTFSVYPTPETFGDQSSTEAAMGDRYPRKRGAERLATPGAWDAAATNGAAYTLAEYLGWTNRYTGGNPTFTTPGFGPPGTANGRTDTPALTTNASLGRPAGATLYGTVTPTLPVVLDWRNFRDATWENYGYDLDVNRYVANRPAAWDPGIDPEQAAPVNPTDVRGYPTGDARRTWWSTNKFDPTNPLVTPRRFKGYTMGPGYWGKSFFVWPPDPRTPAEAAGATPAVPGDWRRRFFFRADAVANAADVPTLNPSADNGPAGGVVENVNQVVLRNGIGTGYVAGATLDLPEPNTATNRINYRAVLKWIKQPPMCLPPNLRAGRVVYYTSIPDDVNVTGTSDLDKDKAFWKVYIDYVLRTGSSNNNNPGVMDFEERGWPEGATPVISQNAMGQYDIDGPGTPTPNRPADPIPYMNYLDNPNRPRHNFWFGPITMMSMLNDKDAWAGTVHESQTWQLKAGVNSVLDDIRNNHPNDNVGLSYFSSGGYGFTSVGCSQDFDLLKASLFYPKPLVESGEVWTNLTKEFRAFNAGTIWNDLSWQGYNKVQNAQGGTDPNTGMATCFNILAPSTTANPARPTLPPAPYGTASASRRGRRGASKIVFFETDGVPNAASTSTRQDLGFNSYYSINVGSTTNYGNAGWASAAAPALAIINHMMEPIASSGGGTSGLSSPSNPAKVYAIGFGDLFNVVPQPPTAVNARTFLLQVQQAGKTSAPLDTAIPSYQIITGPYESRIESLKTAFERILQSGVQVTLVE